MQYPECKVYSDGSHYIAIPYEPSNKKRGKTPPEEVIEVEDSPTVEILDSPPAEVGDVSSTSEATDFGERISAKEITPSKKRHITKKALFEELYHKSQNLKRAERKQFIVERMKAYFQSQKQAEDYVEQNIERMHRNFICRRTRLYRKVNLADFNYFCTFTYDDKKHTAESFKKKLGGCFKMLCHRKHWRYVGVWEMSPQKQRLHFHGLFDIPDGSMPGEIIRQRDYSPIKKQVQTTYQNTYFNERFGRSDFSKIDGKESLTSSVAYIIKYIEKTGAKIVYSKNLPQYFISDIMEEDVVCKIGQEDKKLLLFDDFKCWNEGEYVGEVSAETIAKLRKSN